MPVPAVPAAHLVAVQPDLLLGRLEALLDRPAPTGDPGQRLQAGGGRAEHDVIRDLVRLGELAAHQQPVVPGRLLQAAQPEPRPVVQTLALGPGPGAQAAPALQRFGRRQIRGRHLDRPLAGDRRPQRLGRLDRQHIRVARAAPARGAADGRSHRPRRPAPRRPAPRPQGRARSCAAPVAAWWRTRSLPERPPRRGAPGRRSTPWAGRAHGRSAHGPCHWHRPGTRRSGSSRSVPRSRSIGAPRRPTSSPSSGSRSRRRSARRPARPGARPRRRDTGRAPRPGPTGHARAPVGCATAGVPDRSASCQPFLRSTAPSSPSRYSPAWRRGSGRPNNSPTRRCNSASASPHPANPTGFNTRPISNQNLRYLHSSLQMRDGDGAPGWEAETQLSQSAAPEDMSRAAWPCRTPFHPSSRWADT